MRDSDPRPMPIEIQRAYRESIDLRGLLMSSVFSEKDRLRVLDALMRSLLEKHGDVWIAVGRREVRVSTRFKQTKRSAEKAIELLLSVEEYGGGEGVLSLLAQAMQPHWAQWWESFEWNDSSDVNVWRDIARHVLGRRQFTWLAAQYARTVIDRARPQDRQTCLDTIVAAEEWALVRSKANMLKASAARSAAYAAAYAASDNADDAAAGAAYAAANAAYDASAAYEAVTSTTAAAAWAAYGASTAASAATAYAATIAARSAATVDRPDSSVAARAASAPTYATAHDRLAALTQRLITPTLITRASG